MCWHGLPCLWEARWRLRTCRWGIDTSQDVSRSLVHSIWGIGFALSTRLRVCTRVPSTRCFIVRQCWSSDSLCNSTLPITTRNFMLTSLTCGVTIILHVLSRQMTIFVSTYSQCLVAHMNVVFWCQSSPVNCESNSHFDSKHAQTTLANDRGLFVTRRTPYCEDALNTMDELIHLYSWLKKLILDDKHSRKLMTNWSEEMNDVPKYRIWTKESYQHMVSMVWFAMLSITNLVQKMHDSEMQPITKIIASLLIHTEDIC